jgi:hypothetical protein
LINFTVIYRYNCLYRYFYLYLLIFFDRVVTWHPIPPGYKDVLDLIHTSCIYNSSHVSMCLIDGGPHVSRFSPVVWLLKMIVHWWVVFNSVSVILKKKFTWGWVLNILMLSQSWFFQLMVSQYIPFNTIRTGFRNSYQWYIPIEII